MKRLFYILILLAFLPGIVEARGLVGLVGASAAAAGCTTAYVNTGGTGDRSGIINLTSTLVIHGTSMAGFVDGTPASGNNYFQNEAVSGLDLTWDFGFDHTAIIIAEIKWYQQDTSSHGVYQFQGSSNGSAWTSIGSTFTLGGAATQTITTMSANTTGYRYYRLLGVSGGNSATPYLYEMEFKLCGY
jgi:hypothetical protein